MTFDRWMELITLALAVVAGIYAALMVIMKPFTNQLQDIAQSMKDSSQRIERLFDSQNALREDLITFTVVGWQSLILKITILDFV